MMKLNFLNTYFTTLPDDWKSIGWPPKTANFIVSLDLQATLTCFNGDTD